MRVTTAARNAELVEMATGESDLLKLMTKYNATRRTKTPILL